MKYKIKTARTLHFPGIGYLVDGKIVDLNDAQYQKLRRRCGLYPVVDDPMAADAATPEVYADVTPVEETGREEVGIHDNAVFAHTYEEVEAPQDDYEEPAVLHVEEPVYEEDIQEDEVVVEALKSAGVDTNRPQQPQCNQQQRNNQQYNGRPPKAKNNNKQQH